MDQPGTATEAADAAAEAVRALNHLTLAPPTPSTPGWEDLVDVYAVVGSLHMLLDRLPQALDQLARAVAHPDVTYGSDSGAAPAELAAATVRHLEAGAAHLAAVRAEVAAAHEALSHLYVEGHLAAVQGDAGD